MQPVSPSSGRPTPFSAVGSLRRHWVILLVTTALFAIAGVAVALKLPHTYKAQATVLIRPLVGNAFSSTTTTTPQNTTVALQTESQLVNSAPVTHAVNTAVGQSVCLPSKAVGTVLVNSQLLQVSYSATTAERAQTCANTYAKQYLDYRQSLAEQTRNTDVSRLEDDAKTTSKLLAAANADANGPHPSTDALANVKLYSTRLSAISSQLGSVRSESVQPGSVVVTAPLPVASGIKSWMVVVAGVIGGLVVGAVLALWRGTRRRGNRRYLSDVNGVPVLARLTGPVDSPVAMPIPGGDTDVAFSLATLAVMANIGTRNVVAVAPITTVGSVAAVSFRLARGLADAGYSVVLIDASSDSPSVTDVIDVEPQPGLSELLAGADLASIRLTDSSGVEILGAGLPSEGRHDIGAPLKRLKDVVSELSATTDFVIINASTLSSSAGLRQLLWSNAAILGVSDAKVLEGEIGRFTQRTEHMKIDLLGVISVQRVKRPKRTPRAQGDKRDAKSSAPARKGKGWVPAEGAPERRESARQTATNQTDQTPTKQAPSTASDESHDQPLPKKPTGPQAKRPQTSRNRPSGRR